MKNPKLKGTFAFLLLMSIAVMTSASEDSIDVASIDTTPPFKIINRVANPVVAEKNEYYEVCGCSEKELQCDLDKKCLMWSDGKKYDSLTHWNIKWDHGYNRDPLRCSTDAFRVTAEIIFRYPKWAKTDNAPRSLVEKWERYLDNLVVHESGHRDIVVEAAAELTRAVGELPPAPTCAELDRKVQALCREKMKKMDDDQKEYDEATGHGATQGAVFQ